MESTRAAQRHLIRPKLLTYRRVIYHRHSGNWQTTRSDPATRLPHCNCLPPDSVTIATRREWPSAISRQNQLRPVVDWHLSWRTFCLSRLFAQHIIRRARRRSVKTPNHARRVTAASRVRFCGFFQRTILTGAKVSLALPIVFCSAIESIWRLMAGCALVLGLFHAVTVK